MNKTTSSIIEAMETELAEVRSKAKELEDALAAMKRLFPDTSSDEAEQCKPHRDPRLRFSAEQLRSEIMIALSAGPDHLGSRELTSSLLKWYPSHVVGSQTVQLRATELVASGDCSIDDDRRFYLDANQLEKFFGREAE